MKGWLIVLFKQRHVYFFSECTVFIFPIFILFFQRLLIFIHYFSSIISVDSVQFFCCIGCSPLVVLPYFVMHHFFVYVLCVYQYFLFAYGNSFRKFFNHFLKCSSQLSVHLVRRIKEWKKRRARQKPDRFKCFSICRGGREKQYICG